MLHLQGFNNVFIDAYAALHNNAYLQALDIIESDNLASPT